MQTVNLLIKGKVQGVYYRNAAKEEADKSGVTGWVKYISEGRVEAMRKTLQLMLNELCV